MKGFLFALMGSISTALFFIPYKAAIATTDPTTFLFAVFIVGACGSCILHAGDILRFRSKSPKKLLGGSMLFALFSVIGSYAVGQSMQGLDPSIAAVINCTQVVFLLLIGRFVLREILSKNFGIGCAVAGCGFLYMVSMGHHVHMMSDIHFYMWGVLSAICLALSALVQKKIVNDVCIPTLNTMRLAIGVVLLSTIPGIITRVLLLSYDVWLYAIFAAAFGTILSRIFFMLALRHMSMSKYSLFPFITPIITLLLSFLAFGIAPSIHQVAGSIIIIAGVVITQSHIKGIVISWEIIKHER